MKSQNLKNHLKRLVILKEIIAAIHLVRDKRHKNTYTKWLKTQEYPKTSIIQGYQPKISIIVPIYNTPANFFADMVESVLDQNYDNWELILVDDFSSEDSVRKLMSKYSADDDRIKCVYLEENLHISGATNKGIEASGGEYISLLDHDDILYPEALSSVVEAINSAPSSIEFIYTDEDKISGNRNNTRFEPFFKPDWNPDFLNSVNYITHFTTIKRTVLDRVGYEDGTYNGAQDWELFNRVTRNISPEAIYHIPKILYGWRVHEGSTSRDFDAKPYVIEAQYSCLKNTLAHKGYDNVDVVRDAQYPGQWKLEFAQPEDLKVILAVPQSIYKDIVSLIEKSDVLKYLNIRCINATENEILSATQDDKDAYIIYIDRPLTKDGLTESMRLLSDAARPDIGFVLSRHSSRPALDDQIADLLGTERSKFIKDSRWRGVSGHLYRTTRYNIDKVHEGVWAIERSKLESIIQSTPRLSQGVVSWSGTANKIGYRNLYNPYVKVIK